MKVVVCTLGLFVVLAGSHAALAGDSVIYSQDFVQGQPSIPEQCDPFVVFRSELVELDYIEVKFSGSNNPDGYTCSDPEIVAQIAAAVHSNNPNQFWECDGNRWGVGKCGAGVEINVNESNFCRCSNPAVIIRPCLAANNPNWGGVDTATCRGATQTITVEFFFGGACKDRTKLKSRCKRGGEKVIATLKKGEPNSGVTFTLDDNQRKEARTNKKGKSKAKWTNQEQGPHTVKACDLESNC